MGRRRGCGAGCLAALEREACVGWWLPEPLIADAHTPEAAAELASDVSVAFL